MKTLLVLVCLCLLKANAYESIKGAFGLEFGEYLTNYSGLGFKRKGGTLYSGYRYKFTPKKRYRIPLLESYYVYVTPISKTVERIMAYSEPMTINDCIDSLDNFNYLLYNKYGAEMEHTTRLPVMGVFTTSRLYKMQKEDCGIIVGCFKVDNTKKVVFKSQEQYFLYIEYFDDRLEKQYAIEVEELFQDKERVKQKDMFKETKGINRRGL